METQAVAINVVRGVMMLYWLILLARCVMSMMRTPSYTSRWVGVWNLVYALTEPLLAPIRKALSRFATGRLDFSPMILMVLLMLVERLIIGLLVRYL